MALPKTPQKLFEMMPKAFNVEKAAGVNAVVQIDLTGDEGGTWAVKIADGQCTVDNAPADDPSLTLTMAAGDYMAMVGGELNPMNAFMQGKVKLKGDMGLAMKFQNLFNL